MKKAIHTLAYQFRALLMLVFCANMLVTLPAAGQDQAAPFDIHGQVTVTKVSDGDSLRSGKLRIRLFGIDAPERKQQCTAADGTRWACGATATNAVRTIVASAETLECHLRDTDRYGRLVMQCFADETDIAEALVARGLALAYRRYSTQYVAAETRARQTKTGMWAGQFSAPWEWRKAQ